MDDVRTFLKHVLAQTERKGEIMIAGAIEVGYRDFRITSGDVYARTG